MNAKKLAPIALLSLFALSACAAKQKQEVVAVKQEVAKVKPEQLKQTRIEARLSYGDEDLSLVPIYFAFDSSRILPESLAHLQKMATHLKSKPGMAITVEGHCDERGTSEYNLALGEQRARATKSYLETLGVNAERIDIITFGEERPAMLGESEDAWAKNRRAEFVRSSS